MVSAGRVIGTSLSSRKLLYCEACKGSSFPVFGGSEGYGYSLAIHNITLESSENILYFAPDDREKLGMYCSTVLIA